MGNHSLRKQAAEALKKAGAPKLWVKPPFGKKYGDILRIRSRTLRNIIHLASLKPGDIVFDCDGFNHRIKSFKWERLWQGSIWVNQFEFDDGTWSCGCMVPEKAHTPEQINADWLEMLEHYDYDELSKHDAELWQGRLNTLRNGKTICDNNGFVLPKYNYNQKR